MAAGGAHASLKFLSSLLKVLVSLVASGGNGGAVGVVGIWLMSHSLHSSENRRNPPVMV